MQTGPVDSAPSCCGWLWSAPSAKESSGGLHDRVCPQWRMVPGVLALAAHVIAVVCSLVWNCPLLCIAFGTGAIASIYLIYLGWDFQNLKSFAENNDDLKDSINTLENENRSLQGKLYTFEEENIKLQESTKNLSCLVGTLQSENVKLSETNVTLSSTVSDLERLKVTLEEKAGAHVQQLQGLQTSLAGIEASAKEDHTAFSGNLEVFIKQVQLLQATRESFEKTGSAVEEKMKSQVDIFLESSKTLQGIFTQVNEWKNKDSVEKRIKLQEELNKKVLELEKQLSEGKGRLQEQDKQIKELAVIKDGFNVALADLLKKIEQLGDIKGTLADEVKKAAEVFKGYGLNTKD